MASASLVESRDPHASPCALVRARRADTDALGETIAALAARLHAATYELLVLLREFDERTGWNNGFLSCAHWLHWRTGIDLGAAREKVRVARALPALPRISAAMQCGQISYAKVRALTRVATADTEASLLDLALSGNCTHVERVVRAWRRVDRVQAAQETEAKHLQRQLSTWVDDDGMVVIRGRLTPEVGAVLQRAIEAAADRLFRDDGARADRRCDGIEEVTPAQRRADALALLAESPPPQRAHHARPSGPGLAGNLDAGTAGDRYQVVLHVSTAEAGVDQAAPMTVPRHPTRSTAPSKWITARCTFPWKRRSAWRAMRRWFICITLLTARCSISAARRARFRRQSAAPWPRAIRAAAFLAARHVDAMPTTSTTGPTAAPRASTTSCCCADVITARCTKADSASSVGTTAR